MRTHLASAALAATVTVATLGYALWGADIGTLARILADGRAWVIPPFLLILAIFYYTNAVRWRLLLIPFGQFRTAQLLPSMMIGFAANNVLPLRVGEVIRAYLLGKDLRLSRSGVLMNLALERLLDLIAILTIFIAGLLLLPDAPLTFRGIAWLAIAVTSMLAGLLALFVAAPARIDRLWKRVARWLPPTLAERGSIYLAQFAKGLAPMRDVRLSTMLIAQSVGRWLLSAVLGWLSIYTYVGPVTLPVAMVTIGITAFAVSLPSTPGFVGPMQAAFVFALTPLDIEREAALAASLFFLLGHWIPVTAAGALLLASRHLSFREVAAKAARGEGAEE